MVLWRGGEMTSRKSPGDGVWKRPLDAILAFALPVLETAYGRAKSQVHNEKTPHGNRKYFEASFVSRGGVKETGGKRT